MLPIHFAPLQGYAEDAYRRLHHQFAGGVFAYYTPFVRYEHGQVRSKDMRDIRPEFNAGVPLVPQVIASTAEEFRHVTDVVIAQGYDRVDINMGCPFPLQTRHGRGAALLANPTEVSAIMDVVRSLPDVHFSVKMRLGLTSATDWTSIVDILNDTPLVHVTIHPRVATQQYKGDVDMQQFAHAYERLTHPVIYNGDIRTIEDIQRLETEYPDIAGVMIGRGLLARPSLAREYTDGKEWMERQRIQLLLRLHSELLAHYETVIPGEEQRLNKIRSFWEYTEETLGKKAYKKIMKAGNMKNYLRAVAEL